MNSTEGGEEQCFCPDPAVAARSEEEWKPGIDSRYAKWVKTQFGLEEKNTYYRDTAEMINKDPNQEAAGLIDMKLHWSRGRREPEKLVCLKIRSLSIDTSDLIRSRLSIWREETYTSSAWLHQV